MYEVRSTLQGHIIPELSSPDPDVPETEEEIAEREEEQYIGQWKVITCCIAFVFLHICIGAFVLTEVLKRDVVGGLLLMELLPRLRYILEVIRPQQNTCVQVLGESVRLIHTHTLNL